MLAGAREGAQGRVIAVVQPHRYTRLQSLMDEFQNAFNDADVVFVTPVYPPARSRSTASTSNAWSRASAPTATAWSRRGRSRRIVPRAARSAAEGDMVICMGAGDITKWAAALPNGICDARPRK